MLDSKIPPAKDVIGLGEALCFDKNEFMKANFSVDEFLHKNRDAPSLEQLRDNLGLYLKGLRASLIDLINEDYADFVSLSANLVGLDHSIEAIQQPLEQFRDEIESIQKLIEDNELEIKLHLEKKRQLNELKRNLQSLRKVYNVLGKLEKLVEHRLSGPPKAVDVERAALEVIQLQYNMKYCAEYMGEELKEKISGLERKVLEKLRELFLEALKTSSSNCSEHLERSLRIYITLDSCNVAEDVFREDVVAPYMNTTISEHCLQNSPQGLAGIYNKVLNFISLHMTDLLRLTQYTDRLSGFNFLVNSFWSDVEMRLETHMTSIFAPGNSDIFYAKYKCTRDFLAKIEELLSTEQAIKEFREHKQTRSFQARWNLPVYFQICFQEIAGQFESILDPPIRADCFENEVPSDGFQLKPFNAALAAVKHCWAEGVFLTEVFPKFYKLNVQIIMRLSRWIGDVIHSIGSKTSQFPAGLNKMDVLIALHTDTEKIMLQLRQIQEIVKTNLPKERQTDAVTNEAIQKSFTNMEDTLSAHLRTMQNVLVGILIAESGLENMRQVNDLPRLYRKTNRDVPTKCSAYVDQLLRPSKTFAMQQNSQLGQEVVEEVLGQVFSKLTADYYVAVSDVLTSVQKTEESLRRLRNLKSGSATQMTTSSSTTAMSDDDKIRLQLRVDVIAWTEELAKLNFMPTQVDRLLDLNSIVEESTKFKDLSSS